MDRRQGARQPDSAAVAPPRTGSRGIRGTRAPAFDYLIVGAGFAGSVLAERLAAQARASTCC